MITQGKWEVRKSGVDHRIIVNNPAKFIASTRTPDDIRGLTMSGEEDEANARLIAAAPELLAACKRTLMAIPHTPINGEDVIFIEQAIAKTEKN